MDRLDKRLIDEKVKKKKARFRRYKFDLDQLIELHVFQDFARESKNHLDLFDYTLSILNQKMPKIEADIFVLSENTPAFYKYELNDTEIICNPYLFIPKEVTNRLLKGKSVRLTDNNVVLPLIGQPHIRDKINYPENKKVVIGALHIKSSEPLPKTLYFQKFANRLGSAYHHYVNNQHSIDLAEQIEVLHGTLSHDLRGPAATIGMGLMLQRKKIQKIRNMIENGEDKDKLLKQLDEIVQQNEKDYRTERTLENNLSDYLLSIQLIGKNKVNINHSEFNIYDHIFKEVYEEFEDKAKSKNMHLDMTLKGVPQDIIVCGDAIRLKSVVRNLVSNAIKYGTNGGKVALGYESDGNEHKFVVWNSGPEIPREERHKLFKKWQRLETEETKKAEGTGFGLYSAKYIVEKHGGKIWYEYRGFEEKGSAFIFSLPKKDVCSDKPI